MRYGLILFMAGLLMGTATAQETISESKSARKAFGLSLLVPGLGQRYVNDGRWNRTGTTLGLIEVGTWLGLAGVNWQENQTVQAYETLAATKARAQVDNQNRAFFLNLGNYASSEAYVAFLLRARAWDRIEAAQAPEAQWAWASEDDRAQYRSLRSDADRLGRRRTLLIGILVGNRFLSAITALRAAQRRNSRFQSQLSLLPTVDNGLAARLTLQW